MNGRLKLRIITQPYSEVYWGYFRCLIFGNSLTKHDKFNSYSYSVVIFVLPISHIPPCFHANPPDFPRLIKPRDLVQLHSVLSDNDNSSLRINLLGVSRVQCNP